MEQAIFVELKKHSIKLTKYITREILEVVYYFLFKGGKCVGLI